MFDKFSRSWSLVKASWSVLRQDKELLWFPFISAIATLVVLAAFALPMIGLGVLDGLSQHRGGAIPAAAYVLAFLFYLSQYFVIFFFNTALVGAAMIRLEGGDPTVKDGMNIAMSRAGAILGYAAIAATVGMVLRAIQERVGFLGRIITGLIGAAWTVATYLVVPVLVAKDVGPVEAVKESAMLLKKTWGENLVGQGGLGIAMTFITLGVVLAGVVLMVLAGMAGSGTLALVVAGLMVVSILVVALVHAALSGIYAAALYRYATEQGGTQGFDGAVLQHAFAAK